MVGDLHGHRRLFEAELERLGFDPSCDRVLSVGDLVDRGPESLATLSLIEEPWFHAVIGNHELMLLNYLGYYGSRIHSRKSFPSGGGRWILEAVAKNRKVVAKLARRLTELPLALHVEGEVAFNVTHGDLHPLGARQQDLLCEETVCVHRADEATSSRLNIGEALKSDLLGLPFDSQFVQVSESPMGELPITYVGHSRLRDVTVHNSYVYIDQGVCASTAVAPPRTPTVIDHTQFAYWLAGVVSARTSGPASGQRDVARTVQDAYARAGAWAA
ncbi:MAG TPA: metallophosphoesterase [Burkholderiaceae bacterium]|nr:metallophosphoesterase [Burkholderiaceae bacterium]